MNKPFSRKTARYRNGLLQGGQALIIALIAGVVGVIFLVQVLAPGVIAIVTTPLWNMGVHMTQFLHTTASTESSASLREARDTLTEQNTALTAQNAALSAQIADLTALLGTRAKPEAAIVASVLARPPVAPYDVLIIDQGSKAGVKLGQMVLGAGGTPIGTIGEADATQSRVTLFSTRGIQTSGWAGPTRIPVTLTGAGAGAFQSEVPKDAGVVVGDGIYLPGYGAFPVGTVVQIENDPSSPSVLLDVRPYANPFSLTWVSVARN